jgi:hypothetical protein
MKKGTLLVTLLLFSTTLVHANLIGLHDLTPGGFSLLGPPPKPYLEYIAQFGQLRLQSLADVSESNGQFVWSPFLMFNQNNYGFDVTGANTANVSWDIAKTGWRQNYVFVLGADYTANLYRVGGGTKFTGGGSIFSSLPIEEVVFTGKPTSIVSDSGSTLMLLAGAVAALAFMHRRLASKWRHL